MQKKAYRFGVIGAGNMGMAIAGGAVRAGVYRTEEILLCDQNEQKQAQHRAHGYAVTARADEVYARCETVLLAVKPQNFDALLTSLAPVAHEKPLVITIAAGVACAKIEAALGADTAIVRVMPNTPLLLGEGATELVKNRAASEAQLQSVRALFDTMGVTVVFDEETLLCEVIPYAGSAPAYLYAFADAMVQSAKAHGIDEQAALTLFCQTMIGSAKMLLQGTQTPGELIRAVCSPGGTTLAGMEVLERKQFYAMIAEMCDRCIARAYELGKD